MVSKVRNYDIANNQVKYLYKIAREKQTIEYVDKMLYQFLSRKKEKINIWSIIDELSNFIDVSDPDVNIPNAHHLFQTAEGARKEGLPDWFQLTCLLHDVGKIMYKWGNDKDGTTVKNQWGIVGDTFVVGCRIPNSMVYSEFNHLNPHNNEDHIGINYRKCGLDMCRISWGHDEFMYRVLKQNNNTIPEEGYYIIRYHSLYLWHNKEEYEYFENAKDKRMKRWVKTFNNFDLYTKSNIQTDISELKKYYSSLILKFFGTENLLW